MLVTDLYELRRLVDQCCAGPVFGADCETRPRDGSAYSGLDVRPWDGVYERTRSRVAGVSLAPNQREGFYVPLAHDHGNIDAEPEAVLAEFARLGRALLERRSIMAMWNSVFDITMMGKLLDVRSLPVGTWLDGQIFDQFLRPHSYTHDLKGTVARTLKIEMKPFDAPMREVWAPELDVDHPLHIARRNMSRDFGALDPKDAQDYASDDARCTLAYVMAVLDRELAPNTQELLVLEHAFVPVVMALHRSQIGYDRPAALALADEYLAERDFLRELLHEDGLANPDSTPQTLSWLRGYGFTGEHADKNALRAFKGTCKFNTARAALTLHRKASKYISSYLSPLVNADHESEVIGSWRAWGARSGRMTGGLAKSRKKDDQLVWSTWMPHGQPRDQRMRSLYVARPGFVLFTADYASEEYRIFAELSGCRAWIDIFNDPDLARQDIHTANARVLFPSFDRAAKAEQKIMRDIAKTYAFATIYGALPERIATMLGIPEHEAARLMSILMESAPEIRAFIDQCQAEAARYGRVYTAFGRPISVQPRDETDTDIPVHASTNYKTQGSGADLLRRALTSFFQREAGSIWIMGGDDSVRVVNCVHDEIVAEIRDEKAEQVAATLKECMEQAVPASWRVRIPVEGKIAKHWSK